MMNVFMLSVVMLSVIMLSVIMMSVIMLSVVMLNVVYPFKSQFLIRRDKKTLECSQVASSAFVPIP
jgi:hypothetical protein